MATSPMIPIRNFQVRDPLLPEATWLFGAGEMLLVAGAVCELDGAGMVAGAFGIGVVAGALGEVIFSSVGKAAIGAVMMAVRANSGGSWMALSASITACAEAGRS